MKKYKSITHFFAKSVQNTQLQHKKGFTLSEILVVMLIIGVIMAFSIQSIMVVKHSYSSLAFFAFKNLQIVVRDLYGGQTAKNTAEEAGIMLCKLNNDRNVHVLKPDSSEEIGLKKCSELPVGSSGGQSVFCNLITKLVNTSGRINCTNLYNASDGSGADPKITNLNVNNPNFVTTNGQRYYLTSRTFSQSVSKDYGYRLIAIDLNGKSKPNIAEKEKGKLPPDIVTFMIMDNGEVYPLGVAADNYKINAERTAQYISARAKGYYYSNDPGRTGVPDVCFVKKKSGKQQTCNFGVVPIPGSNKQKIYGYREAYCYTTGNKKPVYEQYCYNILPNSLCPPSADEKKFDACHVETIKPLFRFNLV